MKNDGRPIIACCSGNTDNTAVSIIRISGFENIKQFQPFFRYQLNNDAVRVLKKNVVCVQKKDLDSVLLTYFKAPKSYTGENILEIYVHGNKLNVDRIISLFIEQAGCFFAEPGEFTFRAHKNGKISLSQVEGLELFLNATSPAVGQTGFSLLQGELNQKYLLLRRCFFDIKRSVELLIDFSEDVGEEKLYEQLHLSSQHFLEQIIDLNSRCQLDIGSLRNPSIVLFGETNAGKSLFFNKLLHNDRSIVSSEGGTTRDYVSEALVIDGATFNLVDTAGVRDTTSKVEQEGIRRSHRLLESAFCRVLVVNPLVCAGDFQPRRADFVVFSHCDLPRGLSCAKKLVKSSNNNYPYLFSGVGPIGPISKSAPIEPAESLFSFVSEKYQRLTGDMPILVERHKRLIASIHQEFEAFFAALSTELDIGILDNQLEIINGHLHQLIGIISSDEILTSIFDNYCIGK